MARCIGFSGWLLGHRWQCTGGTTATYTSCCTRCGAWSNPTPWGHRPRGTAPSDSLGAAATTLNPPPGEHTGDQK